MTASDYTEREMGKAIGGCSTKNTMNVPVYSPSELLDRINDLRRPWHKNYLAMYSSVWKGIVTDPVLMAVPVDDHLVHRSDGVFEVFKCLNGKAYRLAAHLERLQRSAAALGLKMPEEFPGMVDIIKAAVQAGGVRDVIIRLMISRGPGGFSTNPYECPASHLYVLIYKIKTPAKEEYENGVEIISSEVPVKTAFFANIKSCNYLPNVLVKKEAKDAGVDFAVTWDEEGFLAEGSTENIILVSPEREMLIPSFDRVLRGTTVLRVAELAQVLVDEGMLTAVRTAQIDRQTARACPEAMLCGTSLDVLPVAKWDGRPVGDGRPGQVARRLLELLREDVAKNEDMLTPMFD